MAHIIGPITCFTFKDLIQIIGTFKGPRHRRDLIRKQKVLRPKIPQSVTGRFQLDFFYPSGPISNNPRLWALNSAGPGKIIRWSAAAPRGVPKLSSIIHLSEPQNQVSHMVWS